MACGAVPKLDNYTWEVDVYTAEDAPGWYRLNPYPTGNPVRDSIGSANRSLLYINASDPKKVYIDSWNAFNQFTFNNIAPEGGIASGSSYGTCFGGIVKFPARTFYLTYGGKNYYVDGPTQLIIDKDNYKDYAAAPEVDFCFAPGKGKMNFKTSADLKHVKMLLSTLMIEMSPNVADVVAQQGESIDEILNQEGPAFEFTIKTEKGEQPYVGPYSMLWVGLDDDGNVVCSGHKFYFSSADDNDNWKSLGMGKMTDTFITPLLVESAVADVDVEVQESVANPGYFRVKNPYANSTQIGFINADHSSLNHNHYVYINATDPNHVYIEPSAVGLYHQNIGNIAMFTEGYIYSVMEEDVALGEKNLSYGKYADNKITFTKGLPANQANTEWWSTVYYLVDNLDPTFQYDYYYGDFVLTIPSSGVADLVGNDSEAEYFNLQGMKVAAPQKGQILIKRQGGKTTKVAF